MTVSLRSLAGLMAAAALGALLTGCAVGPDYAGPPAIAPLAAAGGGFHRLEAAQTAAAPPPARWWDALNDAELTRLIDEGLAASPSVREPEARLRQARALTGERRAGLAPTGGGQALAIGASLPTSALSALGGGSKATASDLNLYSLGFDATWELDLFGGQRRAIEGARAQAQAADAQRQDAQVELAAEIGRAYLSLRDGQNRLALTQASVALERRMLDLTVQRRARGAAADGDVERLQTQIAQTEAQVPALAGQVEQSMDQLAVLTGREPGALDSELGAVVAPPPPPASTPIGDPASLLRRRPDIRAAERALAADNAQIGQTTAQLFPKVSLLGDIGFSGTDAGSLLRGSNFSAVGAPSLSWNILNYPKIHAQIGEARAGRDAAAAHYQQTVLAALEDAEDALSRYGRQRQALAALARADASAGRAEAITRERYAAGAVSLIDALEAERARLQAEQALAQGQAQLTIDYIALQKSLGLGWSEAGFPAAPTVRGD